MGSGIADRRHLHDGGVKKGGVGYGVRRESVRVRCCRLDGSVRSPDGPYALRDEQEREVRRGALCAQHMCALSQLVERIRHERRVSCEAPDFDPRDGGVDARALFLLEAPGPRAVETGFVSRDNPDPSAKHMSQLFESAGIRRRDTILWNVVPWYVGTGRRIRAVTGRECHIGCGYLLLLLKLLPRLRCVVLMGRSARHVRERLIEDLARLCRKITVFETWHPSQRVFN